MVRRFQGWELLIVLGIFPLGSSLQAVVDLLERIQSGSPVTSHAIPSVQGTWVAVGLSVVEQVALLTPAALVCYLLIRSGEGLTSINLDRKRLRMDLALVLPVWIIVQNVPQTLGTHLVVWSHLTGYFLVSSPAVTSTSALTVAQLASSVNAGIVEEVIVLGFLVRRLEQRGMNPALVVLIAVTVRVSYHLYYGWNVIPIACWALVSVLVYLRIRRLLPFILCHIAWDAAIPLRTFYQSTFLSIAAVALVAGLAMTVAWWRWTPEAQN